jgi:hypothetical protein
MISFRLWLSIIATQSLTDDIQKITFCLSGIFLGFLNLNQACASLSMFLLANVDSHSKLQMHKHNSQHSEAKPYAVIRVSRNL